jgi:hypothetical protein
VLIYGAATWTTRLADLRALDSVIFRHLRGIFGLSYRDRITQPEVLNRAGVEPVEVLLRRERLKLVGHIARFDADRIPRLLLFGEVDGGNRPRGCPKLNYRRVIKGDVASFAMTDDLDAWATVAQNRNTWRALLCTGSKLHTAVWTRKRVDAREKRHRRAAAAAKLLN